MEKNINLPVLIVGQGIAGNVLALSLQELSIPFLIINNESFPSASLTSGATLNFFNFRKETAPEYKKDEWENAIQFYKGLEAKWETTFISSKPIVELVEDAQYPSFPSWQLFEKRKIESSYFLDARKMILHARRLWQEQNLYQEGKISYEELKIEQEFISWQGKKYAAVIFCEGAQARYNPFMQSFPWVKNKGDVLLLSIPDLDETQIYQTPLHRLLPFGNHVFWLGSQHVWQFDEVQADHDWAQKQLKYLQQKLKLSFTLLEHKVAERPTTAGQKMIVQFLENQKRIGIINGLGSKGWIRAANIIPPFAKEISKYIY